MKFLIAFLLLILQTNNIHSQVAQFKYASNQNYVLNKGYYDEEKGKKQTKTGWILLGSGVAVIAGTVIGAIAVYYFDPTLPTIGLVLGTGAVVASIPFFIAGSRNKKFATIMIKQNNIVLNMKNSGNISQKSIGIGIRLN